MFARDRGRRDKATGVVGFVLFFFLKILFIYLRESEREREHVSWGGGRGRVRPPSLYSTAPVLTSPIALTVTVVLFCFFF